MRSTLRAQCNGYPFGYVAHITAHESDGILPEPVTRVPRVQVLKHMLSVRTFMVAKVNFDDLSTLVLYLQRPVHDTALSHTPPLESGRPLRNTQRYKTSTHMKCLWP